MPATARLIQKLQETLGEEATNDLLVWWSETLAVNHAMIRELADLYFARFDDRLQKGLAEARAELKEGLAQVRQEMAGQRADLIKWMFIFWAGTVIPLAGLMVALLKL
jgi:hypothetical protein